MGDTGEAPSMKGPSMCYHHQLLSQSLLGYHQHIDQLMFLDFISRTEHTEQSPSLCVLSSVHLVCWWLVTCLWGQYQILLVDLMGRKHLMSVLRVKIQRPPLEGECCISVLSVRGRKPFCSSMPRVFFGIPKKQVSDLVKFPGSVVLGFMWKILAYINDRHIGWLLLLNNEGACTQSHLPERNQLLIRKDSFFPCCDSTGVRMWDGEKSV